MKDACGDAYLSPTQTWCSSKIPLSKEPDNADATPTSSTTNAAANITAQTSTSDNVRILRDFINNRPEQVIQIETIESESEPFAIGMKKTILHILITLLLLIVNHCIMIEVVLLSSINY